jgi:hypothetical protein
VGATRLSGILSVIGNTTTGHISSISNLWVSGTATINGATTIAGALAANGGFTCDSTVFTVADTTGDTAIAGTLSVGGTIYGMTEIRSAGEVVAFANASDRRLKKDITPLEDCTLERVLRRLRPVEFTWKDDIYYKARRNTRDVGFIAQEIHEVIPLTHIELQSDMTTTLDGEQQYESIKGIRHERIIPYLVRAIQELDQKVQQLQARLDSV